MFFDVLAEETAVREMEVIGDLLDAELRRPQQSYYLGHRDLSNPVGRQLAATLFADLGQILGGDTYLLGKELHLALVRIGLQQRHKASEDDIRLAYIGPFLKRRRQMKLVVEHMEYLHNRGMGYSLQYMVSIGGIGLHYLESEQRMVGLKQAALFVIEMDDGIGAQQLLFLPPIGLHTEALEEDILVDLALGAQQIELKIIGGRHRADKRTGHHYLQVTRLKLQFTRLQLDTHRPFAAIDQTGRIAQTIVGLARQVLDGACQKHIVYFLRHNGITN